MQARAKPDSRRRGPLAWGDKRRTSRAPPAPAETDVPLPCFLDTLSAILKLRLP
ncbi:hypothetical protein GCM10027038_36740 [Arthrobacter bambusae]